MLLLYFTKLGRNDALLEFDVWEVLFWELHIFSGLDLKYHRNEVVLTQVEVRNKWFHCMDLFNHCFQISNPFYNLLSKHLTIQQFKIDTLGM